MEHNLLDVVFGIDHIIAEFFWNAVFAIAVFAVSKAKLFSKIHKYIDDKHKVTHKEGEY
jgi:hypothetical protein